MPEKVKVVIQYKQFSRMVSGTKMELIFRWKN